MKEHYKVWDIDINKYFTLTDSHDKLIFLLRLGILAPSSHNSQPWKFKIEANSISIFLEPKRLLEFSDANNRQAYISLGCVLENLLITADYFGLKYTYAVGDDLTPYAAKIEFSNLNEQAFPSSDTQQLATFITKRHVNRNKYDLKPLPERHLAFLKGLENNDLRIDIISNRETKNSIADVIMEATDYAIALKPFRYELSQYLISNISNSPTGMPGFTIGIPTPLH